MQSLLNERPIQTKIRVVSHTPEQAAQAIRERLGPSAEVLSINVLKRKGLSRLFKKDQLEVIACLRASILPLSEPEAPILPDLDLETRPVMESLPSAQWSKIQALFTQAGFTKDFSYGDFPLPQWEKWSKMLLAEAIKALKHWLKDCYEKFPKPSIHQRIAFLGASGSGSTTVLTKFLFQKQREAKGFQVLKLDRDELNGDDSLRSFCELMGVNFAKDPIDTPFLNSELGLAIDVPGLGLQAAAWEGVTQRLDELQVATRVLVVHSGYERERLEKLGALAQGAKITHVVFSHWDEEDSALHLWPFLLKQGWPCLGLSEGPDFMSDWKDPEMEQIIQKTIPMSF
jgi:flagellar biosynthesis GTPase FlhF